MSTTLDLRVDEGDPTPPYEQLRRQVAGLVASGDLPAGERLPPVRQLAADLGLAAGTVARTYRELEQAGLVQTRRGAGTRVADGVGATLSEDVRRHRVEEAAQDAVRRLRSLGADDEAIRRAVDDALHGTGA
ncbi:GntR family transcriptional regulator [Lapillicoccus jejuensis]|uniref:DNA-binding transcriptional regulator YhcF (GntR family) n=1 Tax=Lapillicoccus jejuensis TaxID=402171 RepID=A0A542E368_9MICO|nr:GntR family transcriptional regulator [Lapillicoccus jejuensis]TQJ09780.1 DNA-binding transcriptional regulator YhcF (GntR family) [Lapillicoccus jejuensis]